VTDTSGIVKRALGGLTGGGVPVRILKEYTALTEKFTETVSVPLSAEYSGDVLSYVDEFSKNHGLQPREVAALRNIAQDVFDTLVKNSVEDESVRIACKHYNYYYAIVFYFAQTALPLGTFSRAAKMLRVGSPSGEEEVGFMNAVHLTDRYDISFDKLTGSTRICMIKERRYPAYTGGAELLPITQPLTVAKSPDSRLLADFSARLYEKYGLGIDTFLHTPDYFTDTMLSGDMSAVFLTDPDGRCAGGAVWQQTYGILMLMVICVFSETGKEKLIAAFLQEAGQTDASYIVSQIADSEVIAPFFDFEDDKYRYKELRKTPGITTYVKPNLLGILKENYERHGLDRDLKEIGFTHNYMYPFSVLSAKADTVSSEAVLAILLAGDDLQSNILKHATSFKAIGIEHIYLRLDLGVVDEALAVDLILACGFEYQYLWPYSGKGDIVVFKYTANEYFERRHCEIAPAGKDTYSKIPGLVRKIYGDAYPSLYLYAPDELRKIIRRRDAYPIVAFDNNQPCGMVSLIRSAPNAYIFELGQLMVAPEYRGTSVANDLIEYMYNKTVPKLDFDAIFVESVTNHKFSQRSANSSGFIDTALKLNLMSPDAFALADDHRKGGRVSCVAAVRENADERFTLYLPADYAENIRFCLEGLMPRELEEASESLPESGETVIEISEDEVDTSKMAIANISGLGADFAQVAEDIDSFAQDSDLRSMMVNLPLADRHIGGAVKALRARGFFFGGIMPYWFAESDALLMQKLYQNEPNWDEIRLFSKRAKCIADMIQKEIMLCSTSI
jgi:hypothetical protein